MTDNFHYSRGKDGRQLFVAQWDHPLVAEIGGARRNPSIRLRPNCAAGKDVLTSPGRGASPPNKCLLFPESKCAQKFQVKSSLGSSFGTFEWDVLFFHEMPTFQPRGCDCDILCVFFCGQVNNRLGKTLLTAKMISLHISGVNSYWFWQTSVYTNVVLLRFWRRLPKRTNLCNACGLERYLTMILPWQQGAYW